MTNEINRRTFMTTAAAFGTGLAGGFQSAIGQDTSFLLKVDTRTLEVDKKAATVFRVLGPNQKSGLIATEGDRLSG